LAAIKADIECIFSLKKQSDNDSDNEEDDQNKNQKRTGNKEHYRYLIHGDDHRNGQHYLGPAVLHLMEEYPLYSLDFASLYGDASTRSADEAILRIFKEAVRNSPSVIYWPHVDRFWSSAHQILKTSLSLLLNDIAKDTPILVIGTSNIGMQHLPSDLLSLFAKFSFYDCNQNIADEERKLFWQQLVVSMRERPKHCKKTIAQYPTLPIAELPPSNVRDEEETKKKEMKIAEKPWYDSDRIAIVNLRVYIRSVCNRLCKHFKNFIDQMSEDGVCKNSLSLFEIRRRNNERDIPTAIAFLEDIDALVQNVRSSAQANSLKARQFVNESCNLQDQALSMMAQVNRDLVKQCDALKERAANEKRVRFGDHSEEQNDNPKSTEKKRKSSLRNSNHNEKEEQDPEVEIVHDNAMEVVEREECDADKQLEIDERKMNVIIEKLIKLTSGCNIEEMEEKMYCLLRIIYRHSNAWNKNTMLTELDQHILHFFKAKR